MKIYIENFPLVAIFGLSLFLLSTQATAKKKCGKKRRECRNQQGQVTDCCTVSQVCKAGRCYYPGELMLMEERKKKLHKHSGSSISEGKDSGGGRVKLLGEMILKNPDFKVRVQAAFSLSKIGDPRIVPYLIKALKDKHPAVRSAAATVLGRIGDDRAMGALLERVETDPDPIVRKAVKDAIMQIAKDSDMLKKLDRLPSQVVKVPIKKVRYLFVIGELRDGVQAGLTDLSGIFKRKLTEKLQAVKNSMIINDGDVPGKVLGRIDRGKAHGFILSGTLMKLEGRWTDAGRYEVTAKVSLICSKYPSQSLAMTIQASASSSISKAGFRHKLLSKLQREAIEGAVASIGQTVVSSLQRLTSHPSSHKKKKRRKNK